MPNWPIIPDEQLRGEDGEDLVGRLVRACGHVWHRAGRLQAALDGFIELRRAGTGHVNAQVLLCQVKTGESYIENETADGFTWRADAGDVTYWENANAPVLVVVVRDSTGKAWWRPIDEAFADEDARVKREVRFDKRRDCLNTADNAAFWLVADRERERRAVATRGILAGPYAAVGLKDDYDLAQQALDAKQWNEAATRWADVATRARAAGLRPQLVWPAQEQHARALETAGRRPEAGAIWMLLACERVDHDDATAEHALHRAMWCGAAINNFTFALTAARAALPEAGVDGIDRLRLIRRRGRTAAERRAADAALADALVFFGDYEEAEQVARRALGKRHDTGEKRRLLLDLLDASGELGQDVADKWDETIEAWRAAGPDVLGVALQRRALAYLRTGSPELARQTFERAAATWQLRDGADEQVAEAALSAATVDEMTGVLAPSRMPLGARQAASLARGAVWTPAARSDRLVNAGLAFLADKRRPDALNYLTLAAMVDRRAGNFASYRRSAYFLARAYEDADELGEALRFWIMVGMASRTREIAPLIAPVDLVPKLRLATGPPWERDASFAALVEGSHALDRATVTGLGATVIDAARPPYRLSAPHPSFHARHALTRLCDRLPKRFAKDAGNILSEDVRWASPLAPDAAKALAVLDERGLHDAVPTILEAVLAGDDLPVTISPFLSDVSRARGGRRRISVAARGGNPVALQEAAAADMPRTSEALRLRCERTIHAAVKATRSHRAGHPPPGPSLGTDVAHLAHIARHCSARLQGRFVDMVLTMVDDPHLDEPSKISGVISIKILAPDLAPTPARRALSALRAIVEGAREVPSAPELIADHRNPKRARNTLLFKAPPGGMAQEIAAAVLALEAHAATPATARQH